MSLDQMRRSALDVRRLTQCAYMVQMRSRHLLLSRSGLLGEDANGNGPIVDREKVSVSRAIGCAGGVPALPAGSISDPCAFSTLGILQISRRS